MKKVVVNPEDMLYSYDAKDGSFVGVWEDKVLIFQNYTLTDTISFQAKGGYNITVKKSAIKSLKEESKQLTLETVKGEKFVVEDKHWEELKEFYND